MKLTEFILKIQIDWLKLFWIIYKNFKLVEYDQFKNQGLESSFKQLTNIVNNISVKNLKI